jgi:hypothetical protein
VTVFTGGNLDAFRCQSLSDGSVSNIVIWCGRFLDEPWLQRLELLHVLDRLRHVPDLCRKEGN